MNLLHKYPGINTFKTKRPSPLMYAALIAATSLMVGVLSAEAKRPNFLVITVDDMGFNTPGVYGGVPADVTPNIDRLASEGMRFNHGYVALSICQASRQSMMTGRYPHNAGFRWFEPVADGVPILSAVLHEHGYVSGCIGKAEHYQPRHAYNWHVSYDMNELRGGRNPDEYYYYVRMLIEEANRRNAPFFLKANTHDPHRPFHGQTPEELHVEHYRVLQERMEALGGRWAEPTKVYTVDDLETDPLGFLPPTPVVLKETAQYLSSCRRADDSVGAILRALRDAGQEDNTVVIFLSDNGMPFPFAKAQTYIHSIRTPFIVRWPGVVEPNSVDDTTIVSTNDLMPTVLEIVDIPLPAPVDGRSITSALRGDPMTDRDSMVGVFYNIYQVAGERRPEDVREFQTRSYIKGDFIYIYNHWSDGVKMNRAKGIPPILASLREHGHEDRLNFFHFRTKEELYHIGSDLHALNNLAERPAYANVLSEYRQRLLQWMAEFGDVDLQDEYNAFLRNK